MSKEKINILDSFAILCHLEQSQGWQKVLNLLEKAARKKIRLFMSLINLGEVYYIMKRERGLEAAERVILDINQLPIEKIDITWERIKQAASIKADHPIAYADAFVAGLGQEFNSPIVTGDPKFKQLEEIVSVIWL